MIKPMQATSDGDAYESNKSEGIWRAGINLPFKPESTRSRSKNSVWYSRIECYGESKADAEELRDAVLAAVTQQVPADGEALARRFHEAYERLAPSFGYETRTETRQFDPATPNGRLMIAVCSELASHQQAPQPVVDDEVTRLRELAATCYAGLGAECNLPEAWLDALYAASAGESFSTDGLLPYVTDASQPQQGAVDDAACIAVYDKVTQANFTRDVKSPERKAEIVHAALAAHGKEGPATGRSDGSDWLDYGVTPADHERRARHFAGIDQQAGADANLRQAAQMVIDRFLPDKHEYIFSKRFALENLVKALAKLPAPVETVPYIELALYEGDKETEYPGYYRVRILYDAWSWEIDHNELLTNRIDIVFPQSTDNYYKAPLTHICAWIDGKSQMIQLSRALMLGPEATTPVFKVGQLSLATESPRHG